jgi:hypothetical protein
MKKILFVVVSILLFVLFSGSASAMQCREVTYCTNIYQNDTVYKVMNDIYFTDGTYTNACFCASHNPILRDCQNFLTENVIIDLQGHTIYPMSPDKGGNFSFSWPALAFYVSGNATNWKIRNGWINYKYHSSEAYPSAGIIADYSWKNLCIENIFANGTLVQSASTGIYVVGGWGTVLTIRDSNFSNFYHSPVLGADVSIRIPQSQIQSCNVKYTTNQSYGMGNYFSQNSCSPSFLHCGASVESLCAPAPARCIVMNCSGLTGFPMIIMGVLCGTANFLICQPLLLGLLIMAGVVWKLHKKQHEGGG